MFVNISPKIGCRNIRLTIIMVDGVCRVGLVSSDIFILLLTASINLWELVIWKALLRESRFLLFIPFDSVTKLKCIPHSLWFVILSDTATVAQVSTLKQVNTI